MGQLTIHYHLFPGGVDGAIRALHTNRKEYSPQCTLLVRRVRVDKEKAPTCQGPPAGVALEHPVLRNGAVRLLAVAIAGLQAAAGVEGP